MLVDLLESIKLSSLKLYIITKLILSLVKVVNETNNNINHDLIFMPVVICCLSFHAFHVLIFLCCLSSNHLTLVLYTVIGESEGSPPECSTYPSNNNNNGLRTFNSSMWPVASTPGSFRTRKGAWGRGYVAWGSLRLAPISTPRSKVMAMFSVVSSY